MVKNIKVDLIYYTIGTDFEMEFNLCGCCRMRLLTDTVSNRNEFSKSLARGVSRSNIVIACGPIFGEKGLVSTVAKVTNIGTQTIDNRKYGIEEENEIKVLKGSTPLVTSDGTFCGCIIENGPQVIILLTESKSLRKRVMKELVHPYISQWSFIASQNGTKAPISHVEINNSETEEADTGADSEENNEKPEFTTSDTGFVLDNQETGNDNFSFNVNEDKDDLFSMTSFNRSKEVEAQNNRYYLEDFDNASFIEKKEKNLFLIFLIVFTVFIALAILFFAVIRPLLLGADIVEYLKSAFTPRSATEMFINLL